MTGLNLFQLKSGFFKNHKVIYLLCLIPLYGTYLSSIFTHQAFWHPESIVQSFFWNYPDVSFYEVLFDPIKMDQYPGRFRYLTYIVEGLYWKLFSAGYFPFTFHDYFAVLSNLVIATFLFSVLKKSGGRTLDALIMTLFFLTSSSVFFTSVWQCRKAKYLVTLTLVLLISRITFRRQTSKFDKWIILICFSGFFIDPYFIILAPIVCMAWGMRLKNCSAIFTTYIIGTVLAIVVASFLNNFVSGWVNYNNHFFLRPVEGLSEQYFNIYGVRFFWQIFIDILVPSFISNKLYGYFLGVGFFVFAIYRLIRFNDFFSLVLLIMIPVMAFVCVPHPVKKYFATYYGHPVLFLFIFLLYEFLRNEKKTFQGCSILIRAGIIMSIYSNYVACDKLYLGWRQGAFESFSSLVNYEKDSQIIFNLKKTLASSHTKNIRLALDRISEYQVQDVYAFEHRQNSIDWPHHALAYFGIPAIFQREMESGRLILIDQNKLKGLISDNFYRDITY